MKFLLTTLLALAAHAPGALADERIAGVVSATTVTHCDATRKGGCAGTLTLRRAQGEILVVQVPLGTPISRGSDRVLLHALNGKTVFVTLSSDLAGYVARAVEVAEP